MALVLRSSKKCQQCSSAKIKTGFYCFQFRLSLGSTRPKKACIGGLGSWTCEENMKHFFVRKSFQPAVFNRRVTPSDARKYRDIELSFCDRLYQLPIDYKNGKSSLANLSPPYSLGFVPWLKISIKINAQSKIS